MFLQQCVPVQREVGQFKSQISCVLLWVRTYNILSHVRRAIDICGSDGKVGSCPLYLYPTPLVIPEVDLNHWIRRALVRLSLGFFGFFFRQALILPKLPVNRYTLKSTGDAWLRKCMAVPASLICLCHINSYFHCAFPSSSCSKPKSL